jgi:hypothetical protein
MKKFLVLLCTLFALCACKQSKDTKEQAKEEKAPAASEQSAITGYCYKAPKCDQAAQHPISPITLAQCQSSGGKSWKGQAGNGCQDL